MINTQMKMKNLLYILAGFLLVFSSCDYNDENFEGLDDMTEPTDVKSVELKLTDDDYDAIGGDVASYGNFSSSALPADYLPDYFAELYPTYDAGSVVNVTYDYYRGGLSYIYDLVDANQYELTSADYDSFGTASGEPGNYNNFAWNMPAGDYLPDFLLALYPNAEDGDLAFITYEYYDYGTSTVTDLYAFDGTAWSVSEGGLPEGVILYTLTSDDYDSMGEDSGLPGRYNNFSSSAEPEDYLPTFLALNNPYAQEGDMIAVLYKYYSSGSTTTRGKQYTYTDGVWLEYQTTIEKTDQYILTASGWVFDPTVLLEMEAADYQMIVDYVNSTYGAEYIDSYGTADFYYGASAYYSNFDARDGKFNADVFASWDEAVAEGIQSGLLPQKYEKAQTQVDGIDVFYVVTFNMYGADASIYSMRFQCTKSGPDAEFEYVEDSLTEK